VFIKKRIEKEPHGKQRALAFPSILFLINIDGKALAPNE